MENDDVLEGSAVVSTTVALLGYDEKEIGGIWDQDSDRSLIRKVWNDFRDRMLWARNYAPHLFEKTEYELMKVYRYDPMICRLRINFWNEYQLAQDRGVRMYLRNILAGGCSPDHWNRVVTKSAHNIAWIVCPVADYISSNLQMFYRSQRKIEEVLELPISDDRGRPDTKLIGELTKIWQMLENRIHGAVVQKVAVRQQIDQRTTHMAADPMMSMPLDELQAIESNLKKIGVQLKAAETRAETFDAIEEASRVRPKVEVSRGDERADGAHHSIDADEGLTRLD